MQAQLDDDVDDRRGVTGGSDEEEGGEDEEGAPAGRGARMAARLKQDAAEVCRLSLHVCNDDVCVRARACVRVCVVLL